MRASFSGTFLALGLIVAAPVAWAGCPAGFGRDPVTHECYKEQPPAIPRPPSLEIVASVPDAEILEDGVVIGKERVVLRKPGAHTLVLRAAHHFTETTKVVVRRADERQTVVLAAWPSVYFKLDEGCGHPNDWTLRVDGKTLTESDAVDPESSVSPAAAAGSLPGVPAASGQGLRIVLRARGLHLFEAAAEHHSSWARTFETPSADGNVAVCLQPDPATLSVRNGAVIPGDLLRPLRDLHVVLDGKAGDANGVWQNVSTGVSHSIVLRSGPWRHEMSWTPEPGERGELSIAFPGVVNQSFTPSKQYFRHLQRHCAPEGPTRWTYGVDARACRALGYFRYKGNNYDDALQYYQRGCDADDDREESARACLALASIQRQLSEKKQERSRYKSWDKLAREVCESFGPQPPPSAPPELQQSQLTARQEPSVWPLPPAEIGIAGFQPHESQSELSLEAVGVMACLYPQSMQWTGLLDTAVPGDADPEEDESYFGLIGLAAGYGGSPTHAHLKVVGQFIYTPPLLDGWVSVGGGIHEVFRYVGRRTSDTDTEPLFLPFGFGLNATVLLFYPRLPVFLRGQAEAAMVVNQKGTIGLGAALGFAPSRGAIIEAGMSYDSIPSDSREVSVAGETTTAYRYTYQPSFVLRYSVHFGLN